MKSSQSESNPRFFSRELSWLEFNHRVIEEAYDTSVPLLERLKFLAIAASNLDEFFKVRVGGLQCALRDGATRPDDAGLTPRQQLKRITERVRKMYEDLYDGFLNQVEPQLHQSGIRRYRCDELDEKQQVFLERFYADHIESIISPMSLDQESGPMLIDSSLIVCVRLQGGERFSKAVSTEDSSSQDASRYAFIPLAGPLSRIVSIPSAETFGYVLLEDVIEHFAEHLFSGAKLLECVPFRITRNADMVVGDEVMSDLMGEMEEALEARKSGHVARLEVASFATSLMQKFLASTFEVESCDIYSINGPINLSLYFRLSELSGQDHLRYSHWTGQTAPSLQAANSLFEEIDNEDLVLIHPYESYETVVRFLEEAADDPDVVAIKQTLYRTSRNSKIVNALMRAAAAGKYVTVLVELKARFDEARNIEWAKTLAQSGVLVLYGVKGLKTHAKICAVVRRDSQGLKRYVHFGTGNYNESTARLYGDISYMTADEDLGTDAINFFNAIAGDSQPMTFHKLDIAPLSIREKIIELIDVEIDRAKQGQPAFIQGKLNSLVDAPIIEALYRASQAGVNVWLNVRGICCLRPGVKGLSENIEVVSLVDQFLEHARIFHFCHGGDDKIYISSADWMPRNLDRRVELLVPIESENCKQKLIEMLEVNRADNVKARRLTPEGTYIKIPIKGDQLEVRSQMEWAERTILKVKADDRRQKTLFEPYVAD